MIREVGLAPTKAKNIKRLSELLLERHDGEIPSTFEELEDLPGVGHKPLVSSSLKHSAFQHSQLILTSIDSLHAGVSPMDVMLSKPKRT